MVGRYGATAALALDGDTVAGFTTFYGDADERVYRSKQAKLGHAGQGPL